MLGPETDTGQASSSAQWCACYSADVTRTFLVEAQTSAKTYEVDLSSGTCTCSTPEKPCFHLNKARDIHVEGCKRSRFEIVSAVHKEIRRGDVGAALYWADLLSKYSDSYVTNYARRIVGEETRNWTLFAQALSPGELSYRDLVASLASSRKKWEHKNGYSLFEEQLRSYNRETYGAAPWKTVMDGLTEAIATDDVPRLYDAWMVLDSSEAPEAAIAMDHVLVAEAERRFPGIADLERIVREYRDHDTLDVWEVRLALVEMIAGAWDPSLNEHPYRGGVLPAFNDGKLLRRFPTYVYDGHVRQGRRRIEEHRDEIAPGKPQPEGIDLRWSGQFEGVAWRYAAFAQFGDAYKEMAWERVEMPPEYWESRSSDVIVGRGCSSARARAGAAAGAGAP